LQNVFANWVIFYAPNKLLVETSTQNLYFRNS
jgi:hypothetical protein